MSTHADELCRTNSRGVAKLTCTMQVAEEWVGPFEIPPCAALGSDSGWNDFGMIFGVCHGEEYQVLR